MYAFEVFEPELSIKEFLNHLKRNKLYFPSNLNISQLFTHCRILIVQGIHDIPIETKQDKTPYARFRATYYNSQLRSFLGRTYISTKIHVTKAMSTIQEFQDSLLITYSSDQCLNLIIEVSIFYECINGEIENEMAIGHFCIDISKQDAGKKKCNLYSNSPNTLLLKHKVSIILIRP